LTQRQPPPVAVPRYGSRSLAEVVPSLLASLGVPDVQNRLALPAASRACLLVIDGLGWELLKASDVAAPFLNSIAWEPATSGFPATTAASLTMLATGLPPGEHGLVGYTLPIPGYDRALNALTWSLYGLGPRVDLRDQVMPERVQPAATLAERAAAMGMPTHHVGPAFHEGSGLTRAMGRGARFHGADSLAAVYETALRLLDTAPALVDGYYPGLDAAGHVHGVTSKAWRSELISIDNSLRMFAEQLPSNTTLVITGDHGMVDLRPEERLDLADHADLSDGVTMLAGEARARYVMTAPGAREDVLGRWRSSLGDRMWIWTREEAIDAGIFGPTVSAQAAERIGDIVAAAFGRVGIVQRDVDPAQARLNGHHGSLTPEEQLVPLLVYCA
jgi:predicted AlkP superfamily pyrophosphatase or phosphodiesterase